MKIFVTGAQGMLGKEVCAAAFLERIECFGFYRRSIDIMSRDSIRSAFDAHKPTVVINCAGLTKHRSPEPTEHEYREVNSLAPHVLATECDRIGARLIHVSTDCVFSGNRPIEDGPYTEADYPDATDDYGRSKAGGEVTTPPHLTVRCSFVGNGERGLIAALRRREITELHEQAYWSGSTAPAVARALVELAGKPEVTGVMHLTQGAEWKRSKAYLIEVLWDMGFAERIPYIRTNEPRINRWLTTNRTDVPKLPPLFEALRELADHA